MLANLSALLWGHGEVAAHDDEQPERDIAMSPYRLSVTALSDDEHTDWVVVNKRASLTSVASLDSPPAVLLAAAESPANIREDLGLPAKQTVPTPEAGSRSANVTQRESAIWQAIQVLRPVQKSLRHHEELHLKLRPMNRHNKARQVAAAPNRRSKRRDLMGPTTFSRAVNNRKC